MSDYRTSLQQIGPGSIQDYEIDFGSGVGQVDINDIAPLSLKGDILTFDGTDHIALPVGTVNGQVLTVDNTAPEGIKWAAVSGSGITFIEDKSSDSSITGTIDGANTVFQLSNTPLSDSLTLALNGLIQETVTHYTLSSNQITLTGAPTVGDTLWARYAV